MRTRLPELIALSGFAIAQPLLDLLGQNSGFLVAHRLHGASLILFVLGIVAVPPVVMWAVEVAVDRVQPRLATGLHSILLSGLVAITALSPLARSGLPGSVVPVAIALAIGVGLTWAAMKKDTLRSGLRIASLAVPVFVLLFLSRPELWALVTAGGASTAHSQPEVTQAGVGPTSDAPVVFVIVDALPLSSVLDSKGEIDAARFPHLALLAADGVWFKNATTSSDFTMRAVPAILSGRFPSVSPNAHWSAYPDNLFTLLAPTHELVAAEWVTSLCPPELNSLKKADGETRLLIDDTALVYAHAVLPQSLRAKLPAINSGWRAFGQAGGGVRMSTTIAQKVGHIDSFIDEITPRTRPPFYFLHTVLPHEPYGLYRSGKVYSSSGSEIGGAVVKERRGVDNQVAAHAYRRHLLQASYVDARIGDILQRCRDAGLYDQALIVVVADHGVNFVPGRMERWLRNDNVADILSVPLIMKLPDGVRAGEVSVANVESIDILPTVIAAMGLQLSFDADGQNAFDESADPRPVKRAYEAMTEVESEYPASLVVSAQESAKRRIDMFGEDDSTLFRYGDDNGLVGRSMADPQLATGKPAKMSIESSALVTVREGDVLLPGEVVGFVRAVRHSARPQEIAVAVDGVISAVTRPYRPWPGRQLAVWYALLPEGALGPGEHRIEAFLVESAEDGIVLRPPDIDAINPSYLGLPLGETPYLGVETIGVLEGRGTAHDYVSFRVPMLARERPRSVSFVIEPMDEAGVDIVIVVNGKTLLERGLDSGVWEDTIRLADLVAGESVQVELRGVPRTTDTNSEWTFSKVEMKLHR